MSEVTIIVAGPVGCGKSAIAGEIEIALRAIGVPVRFADEQGMQAEKRMTHADWQAAIEMYSPSVVIVEQYQIESQVQLRIGGAYKMPDGTSFWIDAPVALEISRRALGLSPSSNDRSRQS